VPEIPEYGSYYLKAALGFSKAPNFQINGLKREELIAAKLHDPA
jgi:hypothetical protein